MFGSANKLKTARTISLSGDVTGSASFDGSKNVTIQTNQNNIAVLNGQLTTTPVTGSSTSFNTVKLDFPNGYNADNCVVVAWYIHNVTGEANGYGKAFGYTNPTDGRTWLRGAVASMVTFNHQGDGKIRFTLESPFTSAYTYEFKIVLMKI